MALVVFVVGSAPPTAPEYALARYAAECLDGYGHTTLIADALSELDFAASADAVIPIASSTRGIGLRGLCVAHADLEVHGCGATLAPHADEALRLTLAELSATLDGPHSEDNVQLIDADEALALHRAGAVLLDVRSGAGHEQVIPGATHVAKEHVLALGIPRHRPIVVFCNGERGSVRVVRAMSEHGYTDVRHVRGGFAALIHSHELHSHEKRRHAYLG